MNNDSDLSIERNASAIGEKFLSDLDTLIGANWQNFKCSDICDIYYNFSYKLIKDLRGTATGFTGFAELLIFRFLYTQLGGNFERKGVPNTTDLYRFVNKDLQLIIGENSPIPLGNRKIRPDVVVYKREKLSAVVQIKIYITRGKEELRNEIEKFDNLKEVNPDLRALLIIFGGLRKSPRAKLFPILDGMKKEREWFNYLFLLQNPNLMSEELDRTLNLKSMTR